MFRVLFVFFLVVFFSLSSFASKVELEVYNVGQGNCVLVKTQHKKENPRYMLVDIGSSAHKKEFAYTKLLSPLKDEETEKQSPSSIDSFSPSKPQSTIKEAFPYQDLESDEQSWNSSNKNRKKGEDEGSFIEKLRKKLENNQPKKEKINVLPIHIQTVVITHPDTDHYKWLTKLFSEKMDHIENIIFGGRPENYDSSGTLNFEQWINDRLKNKSNIYFPAIQSNPIEKLKEVLPSKKRTYAQHFYTKPKEKEERFGKAFEFGKDINVFCLSINPTHFVGEGDEILRMSDSEDDNADSLVLKLQCGDLSAILSGDATGLTTTRILNNYHNSKVFLKTNVLLASHHGSVTHESNNKKWIEATEPEFVVISNGLFHGHPHDGAYQNFKKSPRLKKVTNHKVLVGEFDNEWSMHHTQNAIFSTLTNGTITIVLEKEKEIKIICEKQKLLEILTTKNKKKKDKKEKLIVQETENEIIASPFIKKAQQKNIKQESINEKKKLIFGSEDSSSEAPKVHPERISNKRKTTEDKEEITGEAAQEDSKSNKKRKKEKKNLKEGVKKQLTSSFPQKIQLQKNEKMTPNKILKNILKKNKKDKLDWDALFKNEPKHTKDKVDLSISQKLVFQGKCSVNAGLYPEYLTCPTVGDGDCFFHAVFTEGGKSFTEVKKKAAQMRQTFYEEARNGQHLEGGRDLLYEHYIMLFSNDENDKRIPHDIKDKLEKKAEYTNLYEMVRKFNEKTNDLGTEMLTPENKFPAEEIKDLVTEKAIKEYMGKLRKVGGADTYIPVRPGTRCPAEILAETGKKRINVFTFNAATKRLDLMKTMGNEGPIVNILIDGMHFVRLFNPTEGEDHKLQCTQIMKNYGTVNKID